ncbi:DNA-binding Xre family transcriptional regulator [Sporomusaceae bacterium BoRhaA]|uniref:helix-turn-helix domain-containing protein n=1 Tax=Pelorhabdus rhamnosifermentans TaxID=2772457 RepID=UPI001C05FF06|nr:helix-turn-helix transcriptional regulator [Pelorhabdus rhamnosifermentans]MBU2700463.1 DNA-binding Xre family transcriptional regulator [Pelorhabdus rhamnosifermentans]
MAITYKKLWKLLIDRDMSKAELRELSGVGASTFSKMNKNEYVSLEVLVKLCLALNCELGDIVEIVRGD